MDSFLEYVIHCDIVEFQLLINAVMICMQPCLNEGEHELNQVEVGQIYREVKQAHATFLDHFINARNFMNRCIVNDKNRV